MAENTLQFRWIVVYKDNFEVLLRDAEAFVAGDLLWYPVEGNPKERVAPDALVAFGRPKGYRGSYKQWEEGGVAPQVVVEVLSPGNRAREMRRKFAFYERHGVEEYYVHDPDENTLQVWIRDPETGRLAAVADAHGWVSPRLGIRFDLSGEEIRIFHPDDTPFRTFEEITELLESSEKARVRAEEESAKARDEAARATEEARKLAARLRELGVDPDSLAGED